MERRLKYSAAVKIRAFSLLVVCETTKKGNWISSFSSLEINRLNVHALDFINRVCLYLYQVVSSIICFWSSQIVIMQAEENGCSKSYIKNSRDWRS